MITNHDEEIISEIADFNTLTLVTAAYTLYENSPQRNLYQSESFTKSLAITFRVLKKYFPKISTKNKHDKKPLAMSFYPQLRASFIIWIIGCTTTCQSFSNPKTTGLQE